MSAGRWGLARWGAAWGPFVATFGALCLAGWCWILAAPPLTGPDESSQARRAAAVVRGEIIGERSPQEIPGSPNTVVSVEVPSYLGPSADVEANCWLGPYVDLAPDEALMPLVKASCSDLDGPTGGSVRAPTVQYRNQPTYYAVIGLPTRWIDDGGALPWMRMIGVIWGAALLATAWTTSRRAARPGLAGAAVLACASPATLYLIATMNPGGVEVAAAICCWVVGAEVVSSKRRPAAATCVAWAAGAVTLATVRGLGPAFLACIIAALVLIAEPSRRRELAALRPVRMALALGVIAAAAAGPWLWWVQARHPLEGRALRDASHAPGLIRWWTHQSVGVFGSNDVEVSEGLSALWVVIAAAIGIAAVATVTRRIRLVSAGIVLAGVGLGLSAEVLGVPSIGYAWQGRYGLPLLVGALLVPAVAASARPHRVPNLGGNPLVWLAAGIALVGIHVVAMRSLIATYADRGLASGMPAPNHAHLPWIYGAALLVPLLLALTSRRTQLDGPRRETVQENS